MIRNDAVGVPYSTDNQTKKLKELLHENNYLWRFFFTFVHWDIHWKRWWQYFVIEYERRKKCILKSLALAEILRVLKQNCKNLLKNCKI